MKEEPEGPRIRTVGQLIDVLSSICPRDAEIGVSDLDRITVDWCGIDEVQFNPDGKASIIIDHTDG